MAATVRPLCCVWQRARVVQTPLPCTPLTRPSPSHPGSPLPDCRYCCQDRCPNTPHAWQLGWISVRQLDGTSLKPGVPVTLAVASQALSSQSGLRIVPSWAAGVDPIFVG